jgi:hypothetical protein
MQLFIILMIPRTIFEELKDKRIRIFVKHLPESQCIHTGKIKMVTEHLVVLHDEEHNILSYIPLEEISLIKTT